METTGQRPTFLTVLCILSFIAGAWGIFGGIQSAFTDKPMEDLEEARTAMEDAMEQMGDGGGMAAEMMESAIQLAERTAEKAKPLGYIGIAASLLSLLGVWQMWNLRRKGFWMYVVASIAGLVAPVLVLGGGLMTVLSLGVGGFFAVLFIVLYAVNLKHMS